jgi:hypothetical protein
VSELAHIPARPKRHGSVSGTSSKEAAAISTGSDTSKAADGRWKQAALNQ